MDVRWDISKDIWRQSNTEDFFNQSNEEKVRDIKDVCRTIPEEYTILRRGMLQIEKSLENEKVQKMNARDIIHLKVKGILEMLKVA